MTARLTIKESGQVTPFSKVVFTIGRDESNDLCLSEPSVSRNHVLIRKLGPNDYYLVDMGSTNGSYINSNQCVTPTRLQMNDLIYVGDVQLAFTYDEEVIERRSSKQAATLVGNKINFEDITILVADIRDYTSISEKLPIATLTSLMNKWFDAVSDCMFGHKGNIDKFIGDCVYARWLADKNDSESIYLAIRAAIQLEQLSKKISEQFPELETPLNIGIGINTGKAALNIGKQATAIGDSVNLAFRLESQTKLLGKDIIMGEESYKRLPEEIWKGREHDIQVKGKDEYISVVGLSFSEAIDLFTEG